MKPVEHSLTPGTGLLSSDVKHVSGYREYLAAIKFRRTLIGLLAAALILAALGLVGTVEINSFQTKEVANYGSN